MGGTRLLGCGKKSLVMVLEEIVLVIWLALELVVGCVTRGTSANGMVGAIIGKRGTITCGILQMNGYK